MLTFTRKAGQAVNIYAGEKITVRIASVGSDRVSVNFQAPRHMRVVREEIDDGDELDHALGGDGGVTIDERVMLLEDVA